VARAEPESAERHSNVFELRPRTGCGGDAQMPEGGTRRKTRTMRQRLKTRIGILLSVFSAVMYLNCYRCDDPVEPDPGPACNGNCTCLCDKVERLCGAIPISCTTLCPYSGVGSCIDRATSCEDVLRCTGGGE
jgi:hypothetical protein